MASAGQSVHRSPTIKPGDSLGSNLLNLSLQRLIMIAGANRDFALSHSDNATAQWGGAPGAYADVMFVFTMFERLMMQWAGPSARIRKFGPLKILDFLVCEQDVIASGVVESVRPCARPAGGADTPWVEVTMQIELTQPDGRRGVAGQATIIVPEKHN